MIQEMKNLIIRKIRISNQDGRWNGTDFKLKNDKYRTARGGEAHLLNVFCAKCNITLLKYQKDGIGDLLRCYLNRICYPSELEKLQREPAISDPKQMPNLECSKCKTVIGTPMQHIDGRLAFRLRKGMYYKKRIF